MAATIRETRAADSPALARICLLTAAAGHSAEPLHALPDLPGLVYALPYNHTLPTTFGFVLVDGPDVVGYILGAADTDAYARAAEELWWPALRAQFPLAPPPPAACTPADDRYIQIIHAPHATPRDITARFPPHIHIDILPSHQRKSHGRALMAAAVAHLRAQGHTALHVGLDPANEPAKRFYARLGFARIDTEGGEWWGLEFADFRA